MSGHFDMENFGEYKDIEEQAPLTRTPSAPTPSAPVPATPVASGFTIPRYGTPAVPRTYQRTIRVYELPVEDVFGEDPSPELLPCAVVGTFLSWIPIIGVITYFVNWSAPPRTPRRYWANMALWIAFFVAFFDVVFWILHAGQLHRQHQDVQPPVSVQEDDLN